MPYAELVATYDLAPINTGEADVLQFRLEVLRASEPAGRYFARMWAQELLRVKPTFGSRSSKKIGVDHFIWVEDHLCEWRAITGSTIEEVREMVMTRLAAVFGNCDVRQSQVE